MIPEELVTLTQVLAENGALKEWFLDLEALPPPARAEALRGLVSRMRAGGEDPALIETIASLRHPELLSAFLGALREL